MIRHPRIVASLAMLSLPLAGCAAAVVPLAAGGALVNKVRRHHRRQVAATAPISPATQPLPADPMQLRAGETYRGSLPVPGTAPAAGNAAAAHREAPSPGPDAVATAPKPLPTDLGRARAGEVYTGALPSPNGSAASAVAQPVLTVEAPARDDTSVTAASAVIEERSWFDVSRYVASHYAQPPADSVLLVPGATLVPMRWVPCGTKPVALLIDLDAAVTPANAVPAPVAQVVGAMDTLGVAVVYTTRRTGAALEAAKAALHRHDAAATTSAGAFFPIAAGHEPQTRAAIGKQYCVLAIAGSQPADFPGGGLTAGVTSPGWFLVGPAGMTEARRRQP